MNRGIRHHVCLLNWYVNSASQSAGLGVVDYVCLEGSTALILQDWALPDWIMTGGF